MLNQNNFDKFDFVVTPLTDALIRQIVI
jgi:hypothetical protein